MLNIQLTEREKKYLKRMAALQFSSSKENYSTRHPIHFLQEQADEYIEVSVSSYEEYADEIVRVEYGDYEYYDSFDTVEALVANHLGFDLDDPDAVAHYNSEAESDSEVQFVPYKDAEEAEEIPGYDEPIYSLEDYLAAYGIEPECVKLYRYGEGWDVKAVSFTHKGVVEMKTVMSNHIFRPTRTYAYTTTDGDFPVLMGVLMKMAQTLLDEECAGLRWEEIKVMSPAQVKERYAKTPNKEFCAAAYTMYLPAQMTSDGEPHTVTLSVYAKGEICKWENHEHPLANLKVVLKEGNAEKHSEWPFECDGECRALLDDNKVIALLNYMRYI